MKNEFNLFSDNNILLIDNNDIICIRRILYNLEDCIEFKFNVAFIHYSGLQMLLDKLTELNSKKISGKIITTNYLNNTDPNAIEKLLEFENIEVRVFDATTNHRGLHAKSYIFKGEAKSKVIMGSSNITKNGLSGNYEWNNEIEYNNQSEVFLDIENEFETLWKLSKEFSRNLFTEQNQIIQSQTDKEKFLPEKNQIQKFALNSLTSLRNEKKHKALIIAATGTGKTYLAALDVQQFKSKRFLYICHRHEIIEIAIATFKKVLPSITMEKYSGNLINSNASIFCTVQTLSKKYLNFNPDAFDYIIVDEAHHCAAKSYEFIFNYFHPQFILGLTATPERFDGQNIYDKFDNNVAVNVRLKQALDENILCPFNYFGIRDLETIDLSKVDISKVNTYEKKLMVIERVELIIEKLKLYQNPGIPLKCLAFCASVEHCQYMADQFNKHGFSAISLDGSDSSVKRQSVIKKLEANELSIICTRDIFNEGIDLPSLNTILMLRPTLSPTVFIQQLGRGLRKHYSKDCVTVLDFIGNHKNIYNLAFSFGGDFLYDKDAVKQFIESDLSGFSRFAFFSLNKITKREILEKINNINFNSISFLKNRYFVFKNSLDSPNGVKGAKIPMWMDYLNSESVPDIKKLINISKNKSYYDFLINIANEKQIDFQLSPILYKVLKTIEWFIPLKRNYEYLIIKKILQHGFFDLTTFNKNEFINFDRTSFENSIMCLQAKFLDHRYFTSLIKSKNEKLFFSDELNSLLNINKFFKDYLNALIEYGLTDYALKFNQGEINQLVRFEKYSRDQSLMMFNFDKSYNSFREGIKKIGNNYLLYVNLNKTDLKNANYQYQDHFINKYQFQWQSQNTTSTTSSVGKDYIFHKERGINLHLFVRKEKTNDGILLPYYYLGEVDVNHYQNSKPITFIFNLSVGVPLSIYQIFEDRNF